MLSDNDSCSCHSFLVLVDGQVSQTAAILVLMVAEVGSELLSLKFGLRGWSDLVCSIQFIFDLLKICEQLLPFILKVLIL